MKVSWKLFLFGLSLISAEECIDDDAAIAAKAAENGLDDICGCVDILAGCGIQDQRGEVLRTYCCETCAGLDSNDPPIDSDLPDTDETVQLFLLGGQSECRGQAKVTDLDQDSANYPELQGDIEGVWFAGYKAPDAVDRFFIAPMDAGDARDDFGPEISFGERIYSVTGKRTLVMKYCVGGTNVHTHWNPETPSNSWDKDADDGTSEWMSNNAGLDFTSKDFMFKNMAYTIRRTEEALTAGGVPFEWAGIVWLQGIGDKFEGDPVWKAFGENTARVWDGFRAEIGTDAPIVDTGYSTHNQLKSGKEYATQIVKGCKAKNVEYGVIANDDTNSDCIITATDPCLNSTTKHTNFEVFNFYGYDPAAPDSMKPPGFTDKSFHWYAKFPYNQHSAYEGMILKGRMLANAYIREFTSFDLADYEELDPVFQFPLARCDDGTLPTADNICWIDYREEEMMVDFCILGDDDYHDDDPLHDDEDDQAPTKWGVMKELTGCFDDGTTKQETLICLGEFTNCYDEAGVDAIETCVSDNGGPGQGVFKSCIEPYKACVKDEVKAIYDKIPTCMKSSLKELGKCFKENAETCSKTCSVDDDVPSPFQGLTAADIVGCDNFQEKIMDPTCEIVDCCSECIDEFENLMTCITGEVLEFTATFSDEKCVVECPVAITPITPQTPATPAGTGGRRLKSAGGEGAPSDDEIYEQCAYYIHVEGEQEGTEAYKASLQSKLANPDFLNCVTQQSIELAEQTQFENEENSSGSVNHLNSIVSILLVAMVFNFQI